MNILYLDNDECLGYFSLISGLYTETVCDYCLKLKLEEKNLDRINAEALFILFAAELLDIGCARPGLRDFFYKLKKFKDNRFLDKIIMYTSAERYSKTEKNYVNWVGFMKNLFEFYSTEKHDDSKDLFLMYDLDHSGRSDEIPRESPDGATLKSVEVPLKRLGISMDDVRKIVFLDDRPQNIFIDGNEQQNKLMRIGVLPYYFLPQKEILRNVCAKYDDDFMKLGMKSLTSIVDRQYDNEFEEFNDNGYPIGIPHFDMTELEEKQNNQKRIETPPSSIDISGEANPSINCKIQIGDSDSLSLDITKMLEKSVPNDTKSVDFSYELSNAQSDNHSQIIEIPLNFNKMPNIDINDFNLSEQNAKSLQSSININNLEDRSNEITKNDLKSVDLEPSKLYNEFIDKTHSKPAKLDFKELSEEFGNKKTSEKKLTIIDSMIDIFKSKQQVAGDKKANKDKLIFDQTALNDISALSISQDAMNSESIDNSNQLNKGKVENFSIDISKEYNSGTPTIDISKEFNFSVPTFDISKELIGGKASIDISKELNGSLASINISKEMKGGLASIDISKELNGSLASINISKEMKGGLASIDISKELNGSLASIDISNEMKGGVASMDISNEKKNRIDNSLGFDLNNFSLKYE